MKHYLLIIFACLITLPVSASLNYQEPVEDIASLAKAQLAPSVRVNSKGTAMLLLARSLYPPIATLSEPELRLGGLRVNPQKNIGSRVRYYRDIKVQTLSGANPKDAVKPESGHPRRAKPVSGLPEKPQLAYFSWSPDEQAVAFTHTSAVGVELWVLDVVNAKARRLSKRLLNANLGSPFTWAADSQSILSKIVPKSRAALIDAGRSVPTGPTVSVSQGEKAQNRTYQDLLKSPADAFNFEQLTRSELYRITLNGRAKLWQSAALYASVEISPDGQYVMVTQVKRPFSYLVPYYRFAAETNIHTDAGRLVTQLIDRPVEETRAKGFMATTNEKRGFEWRADQAATITWVQALDGGDPKKTVPFRDELLELEAPFKREPRALVKTRNRLQQVHWGNATMAVVDDIWYDNRNTKSYAFNPTDPGKGVVTLFDRNLQDEYSDPGKFATTRNALNQSVLALDQGQGYLFGKGFSDAGQFPFVDTINLRLGTTQRLYQSAYTDRVERLLSAIDLTTGDLLVSIESPSTYPNYYLRNIRSPSLTPVTDFENPYAALANTQKTLMTYQRDDGLSLSGTLYLPETYQLGSDERLPLLLWAYPVEYKDAKSAGQTTRNPNAFTYPYYGSPIFWVTRGFAVLDDAAFPIVGEGEAEPNDSFRQQLVANATAAINALDQRGIIDPARVAVGGHSYGAFMVANLLSHSNLFAAGIARSGAYNRTLTPFGFQREERSYWDAPEVYYDMSPFMHADKMKTPLLLIHGEADNNSGTYPMQSERYFNALKGLGAPARLVILPKESHGYRAQESVLHMLWEQDEWLQQHLMQPSDAP
jgi:dipeptidyl aminopeptidase/acylaminoacyl peptidase